MIKKKTKKNKKAPRAKLHRSLKKVKRVKHNKKTHSVKNSKKTSLKKEDFSFSTNAIFRPKIRVIGIGGGGSSIVSEIGRTLKKANFVIVDTDIRTMKKKPGIKYFYFGQAITHGLGTGMNPLLAREAAEKEKDRITKLLEGQDIVILVASLGGGLGSGVAPFFAEISRNLNNVTLGIFTLPFKFEGKKKAKISSQVLQSLKKHLNALITISNEKIFKIIDEKTSITEAFSLVNKNLIESLESLIDLIYNPGLINIDFADVRTILKGRGMAAFLNSAEASGNDRAEKVVEKVLSNPLFDSNIKAEKVLFNITGGNNLSMIEVDKVSKKIAELNPKAKIIFGISKNPGSKNKIKTTLLITGPSSVAEPKQKIEKVIEPVKKEKVLTKSLKKLKIIKTKPVKLTKVPIAVEIKSNDNREMIRRSALEIKKAQEVEESKKLNQESEWEVPAFLRRIRFKA